MATQENIIKLLPEHLHSIAMNFNIPSDMLENNTDLVVLVLESKSINSNIDIIHTKYVYIKALVLCLRNS